MESNTKPYQENLKTLNRNYFGKLLWKRKKSSIPKAVQELWYEFVIDKTLWGTSENPQVSMEWTTICIQKLTNVSLQMGYGFPSTRSTELALYLTWDPVIIKNTTKNKSLLNILLENTFQQTKHLLNQMWWKLYLLTDSWEENCNRKTKFLKLSGFILE